jgi:2-octaprenyl-6-methoxyphenol hydroxylase
MQKIKNYDVIIIGGGMAGLSLSLLLAKGDKKVACIDRDAPESQVTEKFDGRTVALSAGTAKILTEVGIWENILIQACPINDIIITDNGSPTLLQFLANEVGNKSFGHIIENRLMRKVLFQTVRSQKNLDHFAPESVINFEVNNEYITVTLSNKTKINCKLLVGADGKNSWLRTQLGIRTRGWEYNQRAVIAIITHENHHHFRALEDFRTEGPFAVLPMIDDDQGRHRSSIVWTEHGPKRCSLMAISDKDFDHKLNMLLPEFYGLSQVISSRQLYPLELKHAETYIASRTALVADAAHAIHPIAGQGLNIGLRDVKTLADLVLKDDDPGNPSLLEEYQRQRRIDNMGMIFATDSLNKLFSNNILPVRLARRFGLRAVSNLPFAKKFFMKQAMGLR